MALFRGLCAYRLGGLAGLTGCVELVRPVASRSRMISLGARPKLHQRKRAREGSRLAVGAPAARPLSRLARVARPPGAAPSSPGVTRNPVIRAFCNAPSASGVCWSRRKTFIPRSTKRNRTARSASASTAAALSLPMISRAEAFLRRPRSWRVPQGGSAKALHPSDHHFTGELMLLCFESSGRAWI
jgi:hypothetical protein